tara:strand:+ start:56824 stop:57057 length:234 start_codon:yes stop_codon:yes gene_type:complete
MMTKTEIVPTWKIKGGDTLVIDGEHKTITGEWIKNDPFMGVTLFGDAHLKTRRMVERVLYPKWYKGEIIYWASQIRC